MAEKRDEDTGVKEKTGSGRPSTPRPGSKESTGVRAGRPSTPKPGSKESTGARAGRPTTPRPGRKEATGAGLGGAAGATAPKPGAKEAGGVAAAGARPGDAATAEAKQAGVAPAEPKPAGGVGAGVPAGGVATAVPSPGGMHAAAREAEDMSAAAPTLTSVSPPVAASAVSNGMRLLERIVALVREKNGSDIHLLEGERPRVRVHGDLLPLEAKDHPLVTRRDILDILDASLSADQKRRFEEKEDIDFSLEFKSATGRVNVGLANGRKLHFTMRYLPAALIPLDRLGIDVEMLRKILATDSGLILVAGEPSSGKTTTIMAMLDAINHARYGSITTIENPIEYVLHADRCLIARREVGRDTPDFHEALRASVRKNPDCLLIGEIRDFETASIALTAAETGIETFCTVHAANAIGAISRLNYIMVSGGYGKEEFFVRLSSALRVILWQRLIKAVGEKGVLPVYEILNITFAERQYLRERDVAQLERSLEADHNISLGKSVYRLWWQSPRPIDERIVKEIYGDQANLFMTRLADKTGYKPLLATMSEERFVG